jgi:hypothetical protein
MSTMKSSPRHEVISLRLTEARLALLEHHRAVLSATRGRDVSLAEAAFLVFEDRAPEIDRAAVLFDLLQAPTAALDRIRRRWDTEHALSVAEWDLVAHYVLISTEEERQERPMLQPAIPSRTSYLAVLDAFAQVYEHRATPASRHAWLYCTHLGATTGLSATDADERHRAVLAHIAKQRARLQSEETWGYPGTVGRCLMLAIRDEGVDSVTLDRVLAPYWSALWGLAARGHWIRHDRRPVRPAGPMEDDVRQQIRLPEKTTVGALTVSWIGAGPELGMALHLGETRRFSITLTRYPELVEFRALLEELRHGAWHGRHFLGSVTTEGRVPRYAVTIKSSDVWFDLTEAEWTTLRNVVREDGQRPELARWLSELAQEYGEQG